MKPNIDDRASFIILKLQTVLSIIYFALFIFHVFSESYRPLSSWSEWYFGIILFLVLILSQFYRPKLRLLENLELIQTTIFSCAIFLLALAFRLYYLKEYPLFIDENDQVFECTIGSLTKGAGQMHQPPLDCLLTYFMAKSAGITESALRLPTAIVSSLGAVLFFWVSYALSARFWFSTLMLLLFFFNSSVMRFGFEVRPVAHGLLWFLVLFFHIFTYLKSDKNTYKGELLQRSLQLFAVAMLSLLSLGLQPPFVILALFLSYILLNAKKLFSREFTYFIAALVGSILVFLPLQLYVFSVCANRQSRPFFSGLRLLSDTFTLKNMSLAWRLIDGLVPFFVSAALAVFCILINSRRKKHIVPYLSEMQLAFWEVTLATFLFPLTLIPFFKNYINWELNDYYLIFMVPLAILSISAAYRILENAIKGKPWLLILFVGALILLSGLQRYPLFMKNEWIRFWPDTRGAFNYLRHNASENDFVYFYCFKQGHEYCPGNEIGVEPYFQDVPSKPQFKLYDGPKFYRDLLQNPNKLERVFLVSYELTGKNLNLEGLCLEEACKKTFFRGITIVEFAVDGNSFIQKTKRIFQKFAALVPNSDRMPYLMEPLVYSLYLSNELKEARSWFQLYEPWARLQYRGNNALEVETLKSILKL